MIYLIASLFHFGVLMTLIKLVLDLE